MKINNRQLQAFLFVSATLSLLLLPSTQSFSPTSSHHGILPKTTVTRTTPLRMSFFNLGNKGGGVSSIPTSTADRDKQAIKSIQSAFSSPKDKSFPLVECEFPALAALNKLGDGSLRSAKEVEQANISFTIKLLKSLSPIPFIGPKTFLLISSASTQTFFQTAKSQAKTTSATVLSVKDDELPSFEQGDVCVILTPSTKQDYTLAKSLAQGGRLSAVVIINGYAKDAKTIPSNATMAYYLKPLTYNSQIAGYLLRNYPGQWTTIDAISKQVLDSVDDDDILVRKTNTPDLRRSGKLVQKSVDERAIRERRRGG